MLFLRINPLENHLFGVVFGLKSQRKIGLIKENTPEGGLGVREVIRKDSGCLGRLDKLETPRLQI